MDSIQKHILQSVIDAEKFLVGGLSWQMTLLILTI
jgi:hypothetical protein